jgi:hypothetical protein
MKAKFVSVELLNRDATRLQLIEFSDDGQLIPARRIQIKSPDPDPVSAKLKA